MNSDSCCCWTCRLAREGGREGGMDKVGTAFSVFGSDMGFPLFFLERCSLVFGFGFF